MKPGNCPNIYEACKASKLRTMLEKLKPEITLDNDFPIKFNAEMLIHNIQYECYREQMVSFIPMLPILTRPQVPVETADYLLYMNPYARCDDVSAVAVREIRELAARRKPGAEIIVVGKAANAEKLLNGEIDNITFWGDHYAEKVGKKFGFDICEQYFIYDDREDFLAMWPVDGCLNQCKFCRRSYMHIKFESIDLDTIKEKLDEIKAKHPEQLKKVSLRAENIAEYGIDIYGKPMLHRLIRLLDSYDEVELIQIPLGLNFGEVTDEILDAICDCKKISQIQMNLDTGSDRMLKFIGRKFTREDAIRILGRIHEANPGIYIITTVMIGLPTETTKDILQLAQLIGECNIDYVHVNHYIVGPCQPLAKYPQLTAEERDTHSLYLISTLPKYVSRDIVVDIPHVFIRKSSPKSQEKIRALEKRNQSELLPTHYVDFMRWIYKDQKWYFGD